MITLLLVLILLSLLLRAYYTTNAFYKYWDKKGVYYVKPTYMFGNLTDNIFQRKSLGDVISQLYNSNNDARVIGVYQFFTPTLIIKDPELIKQITIKHFDCFADHNLEASLEADPLWASNLLVKTMKTGWQEARSKITPIFTGSKLRIMIPLIKNGVQKLIQHLNLQEKGAILNINTLFRKMQNDVIATVAFGVELNSFKDENNQFYNLAAEAANFNGLRACIFYGYTIFPKLMKFFGIKMFNSRICTFFRDVIEETIRVRRKEKVIRPDFVHLLAEKENILDTEIMDQVQFKSIIDNITSQCMFFFFAGFETISSIMTFLAYELSLNENIQEKVYQEIIKTLKDNYEELSYEVINNMKYLDNVIKEVYRLYTPSSIVDRKSLKPFTITPNYKKEQPIHLDKNTFIWIPIRDIQRDSKYYPNPEKFDPDRYNTSEIVQGTFIPFGSGPRMCLGARFVTLELKIVFIEILRRYKFVLSKDTDVPLKFRADSFFLNPKRPILLEVRCRC